MPLFFLAGFALPFLPAASGKGRTSSGVKDVLEEGFVSAAVLLEDLVRENEFLKDQVLQTHPSCLMFPLLQFDAAISVAGGDLSYIGEQKLPNNKDISFVGKNSIGQESSLDICRSSCRVERHVDNSRSVVNGHRFSCVVCDPWSNHEVKTYFSYCRTRDITFEAILAACSQRVSSDFVKKPLLSPGEFYDSHS
jgi:hypothetical protein